MSSQACHRRMVINILFRIPTIGRMSLPYICMMFDHGTKILAVMYIYIYIYLHIHWHIHQYIYIYNYIYIYTSSTAQGGGGSFKNRKPIGEECCCGAKMAERSHWLTERWLCVLFWRHDGARQHSGSRRFLSAVARTKLPWLIPTAALPSCRQTQPRHFMVDGF